VTVCGGSVRYDELLRGGNWKGLVPLVGWAPTDAASCTACPASYAGERAEGEGGKRLLLLDYCTGQATCLFLLFSCNFPPILRRVYPSKVNSRKWINILI